MEVLKLDPLLGASILVLSGHYGNGDERFKKLESDGYDAVKVQKLVNEMIPIFKKYGVTL